MQIKKITMVNTSNGPLQDHASHLTALTVENVTKLDLEYDSVNGDLQERQKVEDYLMKSQPLGKLHGDTESPLPPEPENRSQYFLKGRTNAVEDDNINEGLTLSDFVKKKTSQVPTSLSVEKETTNVQKVQSKTTQTQTEESWHDVLPGSIPGSINSEKKAEIKFSDNGLTARQLENPLLHEEKDDPPKEADAPFCHFCDMPKKPFPSAEQLVSDPGEMLFCCEKSQEMFQYLIMNSIELYTPEEAEEKKVDETQLAHFISNKMEALRGLKLDFALDEAEEKGHTETTAPQITPYEKGHTETTAPQITAEEKGHIETTAPQITAEEKGYTETTAPQITNEMKALQGLTEELMKINTRQYINALVDHIKTYGSLFMTDKITFSLASANGKFVDKIQSTDPHSDPFCNIDDYFINCPVFHNKPIKISSRTINECINMFPDGSGHILYPSGNIGILITCSTPTLFTFIILEDAVRNPQIQAIFMSNGHAACYHLNGMLWTVLDPCGGFYFDEKGTWKKHWTWWDISQHVHAPPFQSITLKLNASIEVKMITQDQIYLLFTKDNETVRFNVGSNLLIKDQKSILHLTSRIGQSEQYLCSKKLQIYSLLRTIKNLLRVSNSSRNAIQALQQYISQMQKSLKYISRLASKKENHSKMLQIGIIQKKTTTMKHQPIGNKNSSSKTISVNGHNKKNKEKLAVKST